MTIKDFKVGQTAYLLRRYRSRGEYKQEIREVEVTKIGRKFLCVNARWLERFCESGTENAEYGLVPESRTGEGTLFPSKESLELFLERKKLEEWWIDTTRYNYGTQYTLDQLRAVKTILEPDIGKL
jgi:hypothetical protein